MIYLISAVIALLTALPALAADECRSATTHEGLASAPYVQFSSKDPDQRFANIPTIAPISGTKLFAGDFISILLLDLDKAEIGAVEIKGGAPQIQPSALFYSPAAKLLFSADYLLDKVSVFWFDGTALTVLFDIGGMLSPEGIAFDAEASVLSVAEFDGHTASAWHVNVDERSAKMIWRRPVQYAHGVTTAAGKVYVTSLYDRKIHVFDQATGAEQEASGSQGWDAPAMQFLWPTTITSDGAGKLLVADAETGYVSVIDPISRKGTAIIGGAGPGRGMFSQPYGAAVADGRLTVILTKDERFVSIEYPSLGVVASYVRDATDWAWYEPSVGPFKADPGDYLWSAGPRLPLFGHSYTVYSAAFVNVDAATTVLFGNTTGPLGYVQYKQIQYVKTGLLNTCSPPTPTTGPP